MANQRDRILIVTNDPIVGDFLGRQSLQAAGYTVTHVSNAGDAVNKAAQISPEIIIADINLPGLSGKDLLVALNSQGIQIPVIIVAHKGNEAAVIQTFRLGAADYLIWPFREGEVISAVERLLKQVHERKERDRLARQLQQANSELQLRVRELTTIFSIGKAVTTVIDQSALFEKILDGALNVSQSNLGWFLLRDEKSKAFLLVAQRNLPPSMATRANQPLDDGISSLVAMSGEPLSIFGEPLKRFKVSALGQSALVVPIKVQKQVIGLLVVLRKLPNPFSPSDQHLLEAVADYASISLVNARLFRTIEERARSLQALADNAAFAEKIGAETLQEVKTEMAAPLEQSRALMDRLTRDPAWWSAEQKQILSQLNEQITRLSQIAAALSPAPAAPATSLDEAVQQSIQRLSSYALQRGISVVAQLPAEKTSLPGRAEVMAQVLDGLLSNAIKYSKTDGQVLVRLEKTRGQEAHLVIHDCGPGIDPRQSASIFEKTATRPSTSRAFGGLGISLPLVHELVTGLRGKIWVESKPDQGSSFHLSFPLPKTTPGGG